MTEDTLSTVCRVLKNLVFKDIAPDVSLADIGFDSLDLVEVALDLEDAFPHVDLESYEPSLTTTARELAIEIDRLAAGK